jgi:hypothetical protein
MPTDIYGSRKKKFVTIGDGSTIKYGFGTPIASSDSTDLGHQDVQGATGVIIFGIDRPRPARAKKVVNTGGQSPVTSFIDGSKLSGMPSGWILISRPKFRTIGGGSRSEAVYVAFMTVNYAWKMPKRLYNRIEADLPGLGISKCSASDYKSYVWGANSFKPPQAAKTVLGASGGVDVLSTFYDLDKSLPDGWESISPGRLP